MIRDTIKEKAKFDINDIEPKVYAERCFIPALFCHAKDDTFVNVHHSHDLYAVYAGEKNITIVEGEHNSARPDFFLDSVAIFFYNALHCENLKSLNYDEKIGDIKNAKENNEENNNNNDDKNINHINNFNYGNNQFNNQGLNNLNNNAYQNNFGGMGEESEEEILKRVLELSKNDY